MQHTAQDKARNMARDMARRADPLRTGSFSA
jgi:hypothetical protein